MPGPLEGLVVVDASWGLAPGIATMMLADYGARVIKVERPGYEPVVEKKLRKVIDRNKWSVTIDVETDAGREDLIGLLANADVFIESFGVGQAEQLGLGYAELHERYPELVYTSVSGYGTSGPFVDRPGYEPLVNATLGMMAEQRAYREGPIFLGHPCVSYGTAFLTVIGTLSALRARKVAGAGQRVSTSLLDGAMTILGMNWWWNEKNISYLAREGTETGFGRKRLITDPFQCSDGKWLIIHTGGPGSYKRTMDVLGFGDRTLSVEGPEMGVPLNDEEFDIARHQVPEAFKSKTRDEWFEILVANDIACLPVLSPNEVFEDDQVKHAKITADVPDPDYGTVRQIGPVVRFRESPPAEPVAAPVVGADNDRIGEVARSEVWAPIGGQTITRPLEGIKIIDFSSFFATGFGAKLLCDLGADVIKIEPPIGDQMRPNGDLWEGSQRGKRGLCVDMRTAEGKEITYKLVEQADIVLVNFRPGKAEKIGLGYEQLAAINPDLIYAYLPGFGSSGPKSGLKSFAPLQSCFAGLNVIGAGEGNPPNRRVLGNEDLYNGFIGAVSVLMALLYRQNAGVAQYVESPQLHSSLFVRTEFAEELDGTPMYPYQLDQDTTGWSPLYRLHRTADGWIALAVIGDERFGRLVGALGKPELADDPRFVDARAREDHRDELEAILVVAFAEMETEKAFATLDAAGVPVEIPRADPIMPELLWDESLAEAGKIIEHHHPEYGWCREVGVTIELSDMPGRVQRPSPLLGQHTREVLTELGYEPAQIDLLLETKVIREMATAAV